MTCRLAVSNHNGGVGKTTVAINASGTPAEWTSIRMLGVLLDQFDTLETSCETTTTTAGLVATRVEGDGEVTETMAWFVEGFADG